MILHLGINKIISEIFDLSHDHFIVSSSPDEVSITYKNDNGYVDIGLNMHNDLSYHIRNDKNPKYTTFNDIKWDYRIDVPTDLITAVKSIK